MRQKKSQGSLLKNIIFIFIGMGVGVTLFILLVFILILGFSKSSVSVKNNSWLYLNYTGQISEKPVSKFPSLFSGASKRIELYDFLNAINHAAIDPKIKGIVINADMTSYSKAHTEEINISLIKFKKTGKKVIAWLSTGSNNNYYLVMNADKIYMPKTDSASLSLTGYSIQIPYIKKGLDTIGVEFNVVHAGKYKGTGENYVLNNMSSESKESYYSLLDSLYAKKISDIVTARNIKPLKLAALLNSGKSVFLTPALAKDAGLIDDLMSFRELQESLKSESSFNAITLNDYITYVKSNAKEKANKIAVLYIDGMIVNGFSSSGGTSGDNVGSRSIIADIKRIKEDKNIKAVLLRVNSPGGSALASELILEALTDLKKSKPLYVSFGPIAASGGYYVSMAGEKIFTLPSTITGSIGVVSMTMDISKLNEKLGINFETIKKHPYDDFLSPLKKSNPEELKILSGMMKNIYNEFTGHVSENRKISLNDLAKLAEGRVWSGVQSKDKKLTDDVKGFMDSIEYILKTHNIQNYSLESYPKAGDFFDFLQDVTQVKISNPAFDDKTFKQYFQLYDLYKDSQNMPVMYLPFCDVQ